MYCRTATACDVYSRCLASPVADFATACHCTTIPRDPSPFRYTNFKLRKSAQTSTHGASRRLTIFAYKAQRWEALSLGFPALCFISEIFNRLDAPCVEVWADLGS